MWKLKYKTSKTEGQSLVLKQQQQQKHNNKDDDNNNNDDNNNKQPALAFTAPSFLPCALCPFLNTWNGT